MNFIPVNEPLLDGNEKKYLSECIDTGWISSEGPFVAEFENLVSARTGRKHAVAVTNGTVALDIAIDSLGIGPGDEIIMPSFTIISCILQIIRAGAKPVLVDSEPDTWNMDTTQIRDKITSKTKAIMVVHIYGLPVDMDPVLELCEKFNLKLIEDAAEMIGQTYKGVECGSFGDLSTFSFYPNKHITTGEGGMVLTNSDDLFKISKDLRNLCFMPEKRFVHDRLGWNARMTNMQAALGKAQIERLDQFIEKKRKIGALYQELLSDIPGLQLPLPKTEYASNIYWVFGVVLDEVFGSATQIMAKLADRGIGTRPFFFPMHKQPVLNKMGFFLDENLPVSERIASQGFYLPSGLALTTEQIEKSAEALRSVLVKK